VVTILIGDVMERYLALRSLDLELDIARRTAEVGTEGLRLTRARQERGVGTNLDVRQAEQLLYTARGQVAAAERAIAQEEHALSLLLGRAPGGIDRGRAIEALTVPPQVPAGLPSSLLERRPDIRQAEQELIAANAEIGAARAEYFPRISLTSFLGVQSRSLSSLVSAAPACGRPGSARPRRSSTPAAPRQRPLRRAVQRELVVRYQRAITSRCASRGRARQLSQDRRSAGRAAAAGHDVGRRRGCRDSATRRRRQLPAAARRAGNLFQGELDLARLRQQELASIVQLYRALGGGWSHTDAAAGSAAPAS
jgi:multidrug efflux system outer membrane protein